MFCGKCGKPTADGQSLCPECAGGNIQLNQNPAPKKSKKKLFIIGGICLLAVAAVIIAVLAFSGGEEPYVPFEGTAQEHIEYVENREITQIADELTEAYSSLLSTSNASSLSGYAELRLILGDSLLSMAETVMAQQGGSMDLDWLKDMSVRVDAASKNNVMRMLMSLGLGKKDVLSMDVIMDIASATGYVKIPELSDKYLMAPLSDSDMISAEQMEQLFSSFNVPMPTEDQFHDMVEKFLTSLVSHIEATGKEADTLTVDGVSQQVTRIDSTISQKNVMEIAIQSLKDAQASDAFADIFEQAYGSVGDALGTPIDYSNLYAEFSAGLSDAIAEMERELANMEEDGDFIKLTTYIDGKDQVVGRIVELCDASGYSEEVYHNLSATDGTNARYDISLADALYITGSTTTKGKSTNGTFDISVDDDSVLTVKVKDYYSKGDTLKGELQFIPGSDILDEMLADADLPVGMMSTALSLRLTLNNTKNTSQAGIYLMVDSETLLGLEAKMGNSSKISVSIPKNAVDSTDTMAMQEYLFSMNIFSFINRLSEAGIPDELIGSIY